MDGIGPKEKRPSIVNIHWGGTTENNHVGTHEFLDLCELLGTEPYIAGNVGSGTVKEMADWLEYMTMGGESPMAKLRRANGRDEPWRLKYFGVGNENWGCGGNMRPQYYADLYRQYASYCRHFTPGQKLYKVACGFFDSWNETLMREAGNQMDGLSVHYYTVPRAGDKRGSATDISVDDWKITIQKAAAIDGFIVRTRAIMDRYDPTGRVGIIMDEWGTWFDVEPGTNPGFLYQQNTTRDAVVAGLSFDIFHKHADRVHMANIAQTVNVLQAMALTEGGKILLTPTYHVFEMNKVHHDATLLPMQNASTEYLANREIAGQGGMPADAAPLEAVRQISSSASRDAEGRVHVSLTNVHHEQSVEVEIDVHGMSVSTASGRILTTPAMNTMNTFELPNAVTPKPIEAKVIKSSVTLTLPARAVAVLRLA